MFNFNYLFMGMNNSRAWITGGYNLFALEGYVGVQVERLARTLTFNKSGFYHYFGDRATYFEHLMLYHHDRVALMVNDIEDIRSFDPEYLHVMIRHQTAVMFNKQLLRSCHVELFENTFQQVNETIDRAIMPVWSEFVEMSDQPELAGRYYQLIRDVVYARVNFDNFNPEFLRSIVSEAKAVMEETIHCKRLSLYSQEVKSEFFSFISRVS